MLHSFTLKQRDFIRASAPGKGNLELTNLFNEHFGLNLSINQIKGFKKNNKISSGLNGRFPKGHIPFNKDKKGFGGWEPTHFKEGHKPHNHKTVGTERVNGEDYVEIKIAEPNKWRSKHRVVWEGLNGPMPKGHVIIFGDGNRRNFEPNNLIIVSRSQLSLMNVYGLIKKNADLTRTGVILATIHQKISERKKSSTVKL